MSSYIHFTEEQKARARQADLAELLRRQGEQLKRSGKEYEWRDGSAKVTIRGNLWFHQYERVGGDAIDFVRRFYRKDYPEAMEFLLGGSLGTLITAAPVEKKPPEPFLLPEKNHTMSRVYAYLLKGRKIDKEILDAFILKGMIYESADYHNAVFVGYDADGMAKHAHKRGSGSNSTYRGNVTGSDPRYSFHWHGQSENLYLFEAPIDMLSFISMNKDEWWRHSYAASCGVSDQVLWQMMKDNPNLETVLLCRDNDEAGQAANKRTSEAFALRGVPHTILVPSRKDWNDDRLAAGDNDPHNRVDFSISEGMEEEPCTLTM